MFAYTIGAPIKALQCLLKASLSIFEILKQGVVEFPTGDGWVSLPNTIVWLFLERCFQQNPEFRSRWWTMYALYAYDLVDGASSSLLTRLIYHRGAWMARGDYSRREPTVAVNSLFSLINSIAYDELRLSVQRRVFGMTSLLVGVHGTLFDRGSAWRGRLGLTSPHYAVIGLLQSGDRGDLLGIQGYLTPFPNRRWQPFARFTLNRYAIQEEQDGRSDAYVIAAGTFWRAPANRFLRLEVQWLRNAVETGTLRLYLQFTQGFSWNPVKGSATP